MTPGQPAPDFDAIDQHGQRHRLADFHGRWLALYFYPRDDTPGCTKQACSIRDGRAALAARGLTVLGVSAQGSAAHRAFTDKFALDFPLLVDEGQHIARRYGALGSGPAGLLRRWLGAYRRISVLIDPEGHIAHVIERPDVSRHADELLALLPSR
ncbi:peroxiredoxin [Methyloversatilis sp. NSM2]|uniref:peroxiredoxin n=1 Tax=Methyloversatilis sp. NSM2 TaxID=3134135 RepID=UPI00310ECC92